MKIRAILIIVGAIVGFIFGGSIGIASGGGATNGALACSVIGAIVGFFSDPDVSRIISKFKR